MTGENFFACGLRDWLAMAMISGTGALAMLALLALLILAGLSILAKVRSLWPRSS
ncbi:MAG: hypothetical protein VYB05_08365 [Pseudomonadota bacterium]|nr:hypothetical protein [Pseudomonadota bacterium]